MRDKFKTSYRKEDFGYIVSFPDGWIDLYDLSCENFLKENKFNELSPYKLGDTKQIISFRERGISPQKNIAIPTSVFKSSKPLRSPITIQIELTLKCNLKCKHCLNYSKNPRPNELDTNEIKNLLDQLKKMEVMSIVFTGGEAPLRKDFADIIQYAHKIGIDYFIQSNGTTLTEELLDKLPNTSYFAISFDGIISHEKLHTGALSFKGMSDLFQLLQRKKFPFGAQYVARRENIEELPDTYKWCQKNKIDFFGIDLYPTGRAMKNLDIFPTEDQLKMYQELAIAKFEYEKAKLKWKTEEEYVEMTNPYHFTFIFRLEQIFERTYSGVFFAYINSVGDIFPDNFLGGEGLLKAGNIRHNSFEEIWNNSFKDIREIGLWKNWSECKKCELSKSFCDYRMASFSKNLHKKFNVCGATEIQKKISLLRNNLRNNQTEFYSNDLARSYDTW